MYPDSKSQASLIILMAPDRGWNNHTSNSTMQISTLLIVMANIIWNLVHGTYTIYEEVQKGWTNLTARPGKSQYQTMTK